MADAAKPHRKLGPVLASLDRRESLIVAARAAGLNPTQDGLLVQIAYEGDASLLETSLSDMGLVVLHRYPWWFPSLFRVSDLMVRVTDEVRSGGSAA